MGISFPFEFLFPCFPAFHCQVSAILYLKSVTLKIFSSYWYIKWRSSPTSTFMKQKYFLRTCFISNFFSDGCNTVNKGCNLDMIHQFKSIMNFLASVRPTNVRRTDKETMELICIPASVWGLSEKEKEPELIIALICDFIVSTQSIAISTHSCLLLISSSWTSWVLMASSDMLCLDKD